MPIVCQLLVTDIHSVHSMALHWMFHMKITKTQTPNLLLLRFDVGTTMRGSQIYLIEEQF